jgi:predicted transcriptional regulator
MFNSSPQRAISMLSPLPIIVHLKKYDENIVYWNGIYASPEIRRVTQERFARLYATGVFGDVDWLKAVHLKDYYMQVNYYLNEHIRTVTSNRTLYEAAKLLSLENVFDI